MEVLGGAEAFAEAAFRGARAKKKIIKKERTHCVFAACMLAYKHNVFFCVRGSIMDKAEKIRELRARTGMNRKEFCEYFGIPYRTVSEWERDGRHAPDYLVRLLEYYIRMEFREEKGDGEDDREES